MDSIPLSSILVEDRQRIDHSNSDGLKESLQTYGTIQPLILEKLPEPVNGFAFRLIAGGRRLSFLRELGHQSLHHGSTYNPERPGYVYGSELSKDVLHELELEENLRRKAMTWQEEVLAIAYIHRQKLLKYGEEGKLWGYRQTGEMLNISIGQVNYALSIAALLKSSPTHPFWKMDGISEAMKWIADQKANEALKELAKRQQEESAKEVVNYDDLFSPSTDNRNDSGLSGEINDRTIQDEKEAARIKYLSNPLNDPTQFDAYYEQRQAELSDRRNKIVLTPRLYLGNCLDYLKENPSRFDHIITDPPYAIDMNMLEQDNLGMVNIDSVRAEHDEKENLALLDAFFPLAFNSIKDSGFLCFWADYELWSALRLMAQSAGFKVQRWPVVWVKTHTCMNSAAQYNFTKTTEICIICRKGNAIMNKIGAMGHIIASHDEYKDKMDHPFVKPFAVWEHIVEAVSLEGQHILDPFAGEMSGPISFLRCNRNYFACESNETHFNKGMENLKDYYRSVNPAATFI